MRAWSRPTRFRPKRRFRSWGVRCRFTGNARGYERASVAPLGCTSASGSKFWWLRRCCQGRSKNRPPGRRQTRPVHMGLRVWFEGFAGAVERRPTAPEGGAFRPEREPLLQTAARAPEPPLARSSSPPPPLAAPARIAPPCTPPRCSTNTLAKSVRTRFPEVQFYSAATPLTWRLLVYFDSGAHTPKTLDTTRGRLRNIYFERVGRVCFIERAAIMRRLVVAGRCDAVCPWP